MPTTIRENVATRVVRARSDWDFGNVLDTVVEDGGEMAGIVRENGACDSAMHQDAARRDQARDARRRACQRRGLVREPDAGRRPYVPAAYPRRHAVHDLRALRPGGWAA